MAVIDKKTRRRALANPSTRASRSHRSSSSSSTGFWIFAALVALIAIGGGSRSAVPSLIVIRPACVIAVAALLTVPGRWNWRRYMPLVWLLAGWTAVIAIQLVPLPPTLFLTLPGRATLAEAAVIAGMPQPWRPLSLAPDLTLNSLLDLLIPAAVLVAFARFEARERARTPFLLLAIVVASALLAVAQLAGGQDSAAYLYQSTSVTLPVGLLANRNHQATLMAIGLAAVTWWHLTGPTRRSTVAALFPVMLAGLAFGLVGLVTGSRSGLLLMAAALILGFVVSGGKRVVRQAPWGRLTVGLAIVALALAVTAIVLLPHATAIDRFADPGGINSDLRVRAFPVMIQMVRIYTPVGTGFGTFDPVFRSHEPNALLSLFYFNNAHDDFLEVLITGGVPAFAVLLAAMAWLGLQGWRVMAKAGRSDSEQVRDRLGLVIMALLATASLSDYPLRTPLMALVGSMAMCWIAQPQRTEPLVSPESLG